VGITPANVPEASVTGAISEDLCQQDVCLKELHIDRAYLSSHLVRERSDDLEVYCKAWPVRESKRFSKQTFTLNWERQIIRCPAEQEMPFVPGGVVHFPRARYRGVRKNLFDLRRCAVVHNLHVLARSQVFSAELQDAA
jgi:hypothetical protein